jgi:uncharacterized protein YyaL (SSP411 family)
MPQNKSKSNSLIHESSPYLLQHAYNPVNWLAFSPEAFEKAKKEGKPVLISIGYSACHWCHVMEHESFEDEDVAKLMNENFINIKVDREERSDVDMIYMQAVQLMSGQGGWPLNCFVMPDGRPIYGGTYFNKQQWTNVLLNLSDLYKNQPGKVEEYAQNLTEGMKQAELITTQKQNDLELSKEVLKAGVNNWKNRFDNIDGGPNKAPKFPLPNNYLFLLRYSLLEKDRETLKHVHLTLQKMANGGIYDQLHGGFARYSTDIKWKVPHFEKMLYDNSQLVSLYCEAFQHSKNNLYAQVVKQTLDFIGEEWLNESGCFYSAYDADSEGEEGKYYVWTNEELKEALKENFDLFADYYSVSETGYWEQGNYILMRNENIAGLSVKYDLSIDMINETIEKCKSLLKIISAKRVKPGLDDKSIASWNALMCSAYARAYLTFGEEKYKKIALMSISFILKEMVQQNGKLYRTYKNKTSKINGFLEDYAFVIEALQTVYLLTQDENYLLKAKAFTELVLKEFNNSESEFLFYTDGESSELITRSTETGDNVIPSSNSQMALNLFYLGEHFSESSYIEKAAKMLKLVLEDFKHYAGGYSNWGCLALHLTYPFKQIAIVGNNVNEKLVELHKHGLTNAILAVSQNESKLPLLLNRYVKDETLIYVCENNACKIPVNTVEEAIKQF